MQIKLKTKIKNQFKKIPTIFLYVRLLYKFLRLIKRTPYILFQYLFYRVKRDESNISINDFESAIFSQNGEDGILRFIFYRIKAYNKYFVEFGSADNIENNTKILQLMGWKGLLMDGVYSSKRIMKEIVNAENVENLFLKYNVPEKFDLLSIDIDSNDYWVWKAIERYRPRVVVIEYNSSLGFENSLTIKYDPNYWWNDNTNYYGASLKALMKLGKLKNYKLVCCESKGVNAFFVLNDEISKLNLDLNQKLKEIYKESNFTYTKSDKKFIEV